MTKKQIGFIGIVFLLVLIGTLYLESKSGELQNGLIIERNEAGSGEKEVVLELQAGELFHDYKYHFTVEEVKLKEEEANHFLDKAISEVEEDFTDIKDRVPTNKTYCGGLVQASWSFDDANCIDAEGNIKNNMIPVDGQLVNAKVIFTCQEYEKIHFFSFFLEKKKMTEEELFLENLEAYVKTQMLETGTKEFVLPNEINGISLIWQNEKQYMVLKILFLEIIIVVLLLLSQVEKKKEKEKRRKSDLELDYPEIVGQLHILIGAGMTISLAWSKIAAQYLRKKENGVVKTKAAYEELVYINRRMVEGESEREALRHMHRQIPVSSYHRLIRILLNNKDKGTQDLSQSLEQEVAAAYEQRILMAKKRGEEASTKMLIPLMFMMVLIMIIVMLPALIEFAG